MNDVFFAFHSRGFYSIDHAEYAAALFRFGDYNLDRICGRAEDRAHFWNILNRVENIQRKSVFHKDNE